MRTIVLAALLLLTGCASDADKLEALRLREARASIRHQWAEAEIAKALARWDSTDYPVDSLHAWTDSLSAEMREAKAELDLVRRDINRLLR